MAAKKTDKSQRFAAIEICHSFVHVAIATTGESDSAIVRTKTIPWRQTASALQGEEAHDELAAALKQSISEFKLFGQRIHITLNGDYCVTRVISGTNEKVKAELDHLEERSNLYLSLGTGTKALGGMIREIDARHRHALLTVVNQKTLDTLHQLSGELGVRFDLVEPSLVSLSRILGHVGGDQDGPKLIVNLGERGVEVGISQKGQLLLDYRPPGNSINERLAQVIASHLGRLQRYCDRYVGFSEGQLNSAFLCGPAESVAVVGEGFKKQKTLPIQLLEPDFSRLPWTFEGPIPGPEMNATLGALLLHFIPAAEQQTPNLMERLQASLREPLAPALVKLLWPLAGVLAATLLMMCVNYYQGYRVSGVKTQLENIKAEQERVEGLSVFIQRKEERLSYLRLIRRRLANTSWDVVTTRIGQCLPSEVWLEAMKVDRSGQTVLTGASYSKEGIYEFEDWLKKLPLLQDVALIGLNQMPSPSGNGAGYVFDFNVKCEIIGFKSKNEKKETANGNG